MQFEFASNATHANLEKCVCVQRTRCERKGQRMERCGWKIAFIRYDKCAEVEMLTAPIDDVRCDSISFYYNILIFAICKLNFLHA